jgi:hypothetical protein
MTVSKNSILVVHVVISLYINNILRTAIIIVAVIFFAADGQSCKQEEKKGRFHNYNYCFPDVVYLPGKIRKIRKGTASFFSRSSSGGIIL